MSRVICVLGMHRSGTSCLAGTLQQAGVFLGNVATSNRFNARGNRENPAVRTLNQGVLHDNGGDWNRPPAGPTTWSNARRAERDSIISGYADRPLWGFKDPRVLLTLDGWLEALPNLEFVGTLRHPLAVARSLRTRPRGPELAEGIRLWTVYNARLWERWQREPFPLVSFDAPSQRLMDNLRKLVEAMKLPAAGSAWIDFFDPELQHADAPDDTPWLTGEARELYERLIGVAMT